MGKLKVNFLEGEDLLKGAGKKKRRGFDRMSTDKKYAHIRDMDIEGENESTVINFKPKEPVDAGNIHAGPSIPKSDGGEDVFSGKQEVQDENPGKEKKPMYRTGPTQETAKRKPSHEISTEERVAALEDEIASDFREDERRYVRKWVDIYPAEFRKAIEKREKNGGKVTEKDLPAIRLSFVNNIARWGTERGMALEKANLLEKYFGLKLPLGIPEEKQQKTSENTGETNNEDPKSLTIKNNYIEVPRKESFPVGAGYMGAPANIDVKEAEEVRTRRTGTEDKKEKEPEFSPEQVKELDDFCAVIKKEYQERFLKGDFRENTFLWEVQEAFRLFFQEDCIGEGIFSAADEDDAKKFILDGIKEIIKI